jgi:hypothetical protein
MCHMPFLRVTYLVIVWSRTRCCRTTTPQAELHTRQQAWEAPPPSHTGLLSWQAAACVLVRSAKQARSGLCPTTIRTVRLANPLLACGCSRTRSLWIANACVHYIPLP